MTDREKAIVMAYTGITMLKGNKLDIFYKYLKELFGRPVFTHELAMPEMVEAIKVKSRVDFIELCREKHPTRLERWASNLTSEDVRWAFCFGIRCDRCPVLFKCKWSINHQGEKLCENETAFCELLDGEADE